MTVGGPDPDKQCVFPFIFSGVTYYECTLAGNQQGETQEWCSTLTDSNGLHVGGEGNWGWCPSDCTGISPPPPTTTFPPAAPCSRIGNNDGQASEITAKRLSYSASTNPEENGDHFEGDIIVGDSKVFTNNRNSRWPNGVVPFVIEGSFGKDPINCLSIQRYKLPLNATLFLNRET